MNISKDGHELVNRAINGDALAKEGAVKIVKENSSAIQSFINATSQESNGFIFGRKTSMGYPSKDILTGKEVLLYKLLLLEASWYESQKLYQNAEVDYIAATRVLLHLSQQKYEILVARIILGTCFNLGYPYLEENIINNSFSREYKRNILNNLLMMQNSQDFLESAIIEEKDSCKNAAMDAAQGIEDQIKAGKSFEEIFDYSWMDPNAPQKKILTVEQSKELTSLIDQEFIEEYTRMINTWIEKLYNAAISAVKDNDASIFENAKKEFSSAAEEFKNPVKKILFILQAASGDKKSVKKQMADLNAMIFLTVASPDYSKVVKRYYDFDYKLKSLIELVSKKVGE